MGGKSKKKRNSKDSTGSQNGGGNGNGGGEKKKGKGKKKGGGGGSAKSSKFHGDIFNEGAMENAYCVCHNVQVTLYTFDFMYINLTNLIQQNSRMC